MSVGGGKKLSITMRFVLMVGILLFVGNVALGITTFIQSTSAMRDLVDKNMLDIVAAAAGSLDGDALGALTEDDVDGPAFNEIKERLLVFQQNVEIRFIYAVRETGEGSYVFTVDPDPVDPGAFGEEIVTTPALMAAAKGAPTVDAMPVADRWGNFYSAFCPVFDSEGNVAGVVGVDFDATWYDQQVFQHSVTIIVVSGLSVLLGVVAVILMTHRMRVQLDSLDQDISNLSNDVDHLMEEISNYSSQDNVKMVSNVDDTSADTDEIGCLTHKIHVMQDEMSFYLDFLHKRAYIDSLTQVGNSAAYHQKIKDLDARAVSGIANYWVVVFDLNGLKDINDTYGHDQGDHYIMATAKILHDGLIDAHVYRIGGDEFCAIVEDADEDRIERELAAIAQGIEDYNRDARPCPALLSLSRGTAHYESEHDTSFNDVFVRADEAMYADKHAYYDAIGKPVR